jgi:catechol 2,3-dioxygenase-like lactoylglutathione lyase family enzyme
MQSCLTHFALHVTDAEATAAFYEQFAGMRVVRQWADQSNSGLSVRPGTN